MDSISFSKHGGISAWKVMGVCSTVVARVLSFDKGSTPNGSEASPLTPGSVMGFGTTPGCTGLDVDDFLDPGDAIEISFERLGTLSCQFAEPQAKLMPSRWPVRPSLQKYLP